MRCGVGEMSRGKVSILYLIYKALFIHGKKYNIQ